MKSLCIDCRDIFCVKGRTFFLTNSKSLENIFKADYCIIFMFYIKNPFFNRNIFWYKKAVFYRKYFLFEKRFKKKQKQKKIDVENRFWMKYFLIEKNCIFQINYELSANNSGLINMYWNNFWSFLFDKQ